MRWARQDDPAHRQGRGGRRGQLSLSGRKHPPLPATRSVPHDDRATPASSAPRPSRCSAGSSPSTAAGRFDHLRDHPLSGALLKWGRTLARHGALTRNRADPQTPPPVRRLARIARFGARIPADARLCRSAAGDRPRRDQARPDARPPAPISSASDAAQNLLAAAGRPPARALRRDQADDRAVASSGRSRACSPSSIDVPVGAASIAQVHRAVTTDGREVAVKVLRPGIEEEFAQAIETYEWAAAQVERDGRRARAPAAAPRRRPFQAVDRARARPAARGRVRVRAAREHDRRARLSTSPRSTGGAPPAAC